MRKEEKKYETVKKRLRDFAYWKIEKRRDKPKPMREVTWKEYRIKIRAGIVREMGRRKEKGDVMLEEIKKKQKMFAWVE